MSSDLNRTEMKQSEISAEALAHLGDGQIAYVKTIRSEDVHTLFPQVPEIQPGLKLFALHGAIVDDLEPLRVEKPIEELHRYRFLRHDAAFAHVDRRLAQAALIAD